MQDNFKNKKILVTGVCGTVGSELLNQLLTNSNYNPKEIIGIDNNEKELFFMENKYTLEKKVNFYLLDIRDRDEVIEKTKGIDIIFHCWTNERYGK